MINSASALQELDGVTLESNIRWADAFILVYSITDKCSFDECSRLKFLINYNKRRRKLGSASKVINSISASGMSSLMRLSVLQDYTLDIPVILVGNKTDQPGDRMVSLEEGQRRFRELSCACFHEISVRENVDQVSEEWRREEVSSLIVLSSTGAERLPRCVSLLACLQ